MPPGTGALFTRPSRIPTMTSPFGATSIWRTWISESANRVAQKPAGSVSPALSGAQFGAGAVAAGPNRVNETVAAAANVRARTRIMAGSLVRGQRGPNQGISPEREDTRTGHTLHLV